MKTNCVFPERPEPTNRRPRLISHVTIPMIVAIFILSLGISAHAGTVTVDFGTSPNRNPWITGLGGGVTNYMPANFPSFSTAMADDLFCNGTGQLGLSLLRVSIDPGGEAPVTSMQGSPDFDGHGWDAETASALTAETEAASCGTQVFVFATPWAALCDPSPGTCYSSNGTLFGGSIPTSDYVAFGDYLADYVNYAKANGVSLTAVSLENEPGSTPTDFGWNLWTGTTFHNWFAGSGDASPVIDAGARVMFPENTKFDPSYADPTLADSNASKQVGILAGHCYQGTVPSQVYDIYASNLGIPEWMTECDRTYAPDTSQTWNDALNMAESISDWMHAGFQAYSEWLIEDGGPQFNGHNFSLDSGFIYNDSGTPTIEGKGYAMGQFSKFVRPGYKNVSATPYNPVNNTDVTAYEGGGNFVIVAVNSGSAYTQNFTIQGATISSFTAYLSDASATTDSTCSDCLYRDPTPVSVTGGEFSYMLPAYSVVTFVGTGTTTTNLLANATWATGDMAGWSEFIGTGSASDFSIIRDGTGYNGDPYYLKEHDANSFNLSAHQKIQNQPVGDDIKFTIYVKSTNNHGYIQVLSGTTSLCEVNIPNNNSTWTQYSCTGGTVPASGLFVVVAGVNNAAAGDSYEFDSASLTVTAP